MVYFTTKLIGKSQYNNFLLRNLVNNSILTFLNKQSKSKYNTLQRAIDTRSRIPQAAWLVAPNMRQSPIAIMTMNPTYELHNKPLILEYPTLIENFRLNNTGFSWEVKIPYQISMSTAVYGAHLQSNSRFRLDQFHCHWGANDDHGSEHTIDDKYYSAEIHFVHYNMEKYHSMSKASRHPDGLVVLSVFLDAQEIYRNHIELDKIVNNLRLINSKGDHTIVNRAIRLENLLPANRSYWSYQGSLTTPPYLESVTWFIFKHPIKCSKSQIQKFRTIKSSRSASLRLHNHHHPNPNSHSHQDHNHQHPHHNHYHKHHYDSLHHHHHSATGSESHTNNNDTSSFTSSSNEHGNNGDENNGIENLIKSNHREVQPLNGRTIVSYDDPFYLH